ncbi:MAG: DUF3846 domain-containing protein [Butyricicoccaceae bacterium]
MDEFLIRGIYVEQNEKPERKLLVNSEENLQELVHGKIDSFGIDDDFCVICNAYRDMLAMPVNRTIYGTQIRGPFMICKFNSKGLLIPMEEEDMEYYEKLLEQ